MNYETLMFAHLATVLPAFLFGTIILFIKKGTSIHKQLGRIYMVLMTVTAFITIFMQAKVGPKLFNHFGYIHLFTVLTLYSVPTALIAIRKGDVKTHKRKMVLLYIGGLLIAGGFTFFPGRYLHTLFFG
ncbi:MAG: DUF2306 domain-containing protein [Chitinophagales bacterium]